MARPDRCEASVPAAGFDWSPRTRLVYGPGTADRTGELARELGARRVLLVTDRHLVQAGHAGRVEASLQEAALAVRRHDEVRENPSSADVEACLAVARKEDVDLVVGVGGGSSLDTAKGCNFLLTNGGRMEDYWGVGKATQPLLPMIAIPTTAGTGSETQSFALITQPSSGQKMACGDPGAAPRIAILDPELTVTQPWFVTACTGLDTLAHAVESAVTLRRSAISRLFSFEAFRLAQAALPRVLEQPDDLEARGAMLQAAAYGGLAIETSMLGAAHSMANPLTHHYGIPHGQAVGMMLPGIVRYNAAVPEAAALYAALADAAGLCGPEVSTATAVELLLECLQQRLREAEMPVSLAECGVAESAVRALAAEAARQWTAQFNPRVAGEEDFRTLFRAALHGQSCPGPGRGVEAP